MLPIQSESESDADFKYRVFTTAHLWVPLVTDNEIPKTGVVRHVWRNVQTIRSLTDDQLAHEYYTAMNDEDVYSASWWGTACRAWLELVKLERAQRYPSCS